ncbi:hypothetical protein HK100_010893 [Physocladia obscura]|uniref:Uncharacterized protein n=1 Tax=Physocladia obscura TaxID=109957 RepID=A0AAD5XKA6_9FUNG|nr:hypothetical protein HK100_010893 [Physocladia obscura]
MDTDTEDIHTIRNIDENSINTDDNNEKTEEFDSLGSAIQTWDAKLFTAVTLAAEIGTEAETEADAAATSLATLAYSTATSAHLDPESAMLYSRQVFTVLERAVAITLPSNSCIDDIVDGNIDATDNENTDIIDNQSKNTSNITDGNNSKICSTLMHHIDRLTTPVPSSEDFSLLSVFPRTFFAALFPALLRPCLSLSSETGAHVMAVNISAYLLAASFSLSSFEEANSHHSQNHVLDTIWESCLSIKVAYSAISLLIPVIRISLDENSVTSLLSLLTRAIHWEVLINAVLRVTKVGAFSSKFETDQTQWTIDEMASMDFIIQMNDLDASDEFWGGSGEFSSLSIQSQSQLVIATVSATNIRRSVDSLFTVLYNIYPHKTMESLRLWVGSESFAWKYSVIPEFLVAFDPFRANFSRLMDLDVLNENLLIKQRVSNLIKAHRVHQMLILSTPQDEIQLVRQSAARDHSDVLVDCVMIRCNNNNYLGSKSLSKEADINENEIDLSGFLFLNRRLRKYVLDHTSSNFVPLRTHTSPHEVDIVDMMHHSFFLLLCELNYERCIRGACFDQILKLKKDKVVDMVAVIGQGNMYQKLRGQQQELALLAATVEKLRAEASTTRDRNRKYEEDHYRRLREARDAAREAKEALAELSEHVAVKDDEINRLKEFVESGNRRIQTLEQEIHLIEPDLAKLQECEGALKVLTSNFVKREIDSSTRETLLRKNEALESQIIALELSLSSAEQRMQQLQNRVNELEIQSKDGSTQESSDRSQSKALKLMRTVNAERIKAVEEKYQTARKINAALETRISEMESRL